MAIEVGVQGRTGELIRLMDRWYLEGPGRFRLRVEWILPDAEEADYPYLRHVDRGGDMLFNSSQVGEVRKEIEALARRRPDLAGRELVRRLLEICREVQSGRDCLLVFSATPDDESA